MMTMFLAFMGTKSLALALEKEKSVRNELVSSRSSVKRSTAKEISVASVVPAFSYIIIPSKGQVLLK